jgi:4-alpha-glucanotransferase
MSDAGLKRLARAVGLAVEWTDEAGETRTPSADVLRAVLGALSYRCQNGKAIADSLARLRNERAQPQPLLLTRPSAPVDLGLNGKRALISAEDGTRLALALQDGVARAPAQPGYYTLTGTDRRIAVCPPRAFRPKRDNCWGIGVQLYSLRGGTTDGFGDFAALGEFVGQAAACGADAVALSPVHALFAARPSDISPYAPSTRLWLNPLYTVLRKPAPRRHDDRLVNWPISAARKWRDLRTEFENFQHAAQNSSFRSFVKRGGSSLLAHARFEVLDARFRAEGIGDWRHWPENYRNMYGRAVRALRPEDPLVAFQLFVQWRASEGLRTAQERAKTEGMAIGLIADMAVGVHPGGSHAWSSPGDLLNGLTIGAPPDRFNQAGQNWGLTNFAPHGLARNGYHSFIATMRATMQHAGGVRLDHAMGLRRLWVIPQGVEPAGGVYLQYPFREMMGLLALESHRHQAIVVAEDLGTVPEGFREHIARVRMLGMRVLWFERSAKGDFTPANKWNREAAALSTTHDLPTLAGWWKGRDLAWCRKLGMDKTSAEEKVFRARDRRKLWRTLKAEGCAKGALPAAAAPFADAAFAHIAATPCPLKFFPVEDFIGETEQPNIPGTIDEHPNWRRRLTHDQPLATRSARRRVAILNKARP